MNHIRIAVAGCGAIGALFGSYLTKAGYDVTMLSVHRKEQAQLLKQNGLTMEGYGETFHVDIQAAYLPDLEEEEKYDIILLTMKSNSLQEALPALLSHLADEGIVVPTQNGINDNLIEACIPKEQIITAVLFAGGAQLASGRYMNHDGEIFIGEASGEKTERIQTLADILSCVRTTHIVDHIRALQWDKLSRVCLSVPTACVSGLYLGDVFAHPKTQQMFALLALELFAVAEADGCRKETVEEKTKEVWEMVRDGVMSGLEGRENDRPWPPGIVDAYTLDIRKGLPLEVAYTNGAVVRLGRAYGIETKANEAMLKAIEDIAGGKETAGLDLLERIKKEIMQA